MTLPIPDDNQPAVWLPSHGWIVTVLDTEGRCIYCGKTAEEYMQQYHQGEHYEVLTLIEAIGLQRAYNRNKYVKPPVRITEERWDELLNVLPPARWTAHKFFVSECITDDLYTCCFRIRQPDGSWHYYEMVESISCNEEQIWQRIRTAESAGLVKDLCRAGE